MKAYIWALIAAFIWGWVPIIEKISLAKVSVWGGLFYRCLGTALGAFLLAAFKFDEIKNVIKNVPSNWYCFMGAGLLAAVVGQVAFYFALKTGEGSRVTPIAGSFPLVTFIIGVLLLGESVTVSKIAGIVLVVSGVLLLR